MERNEKIKVNRILLELMEKQNLKDFDMIKYLEEVYTNDDLTKEEKDYIMNKGFKLYRESWNNKITGNVIARLNEMYPKKTWLEKLKETIYEWTHIEIDFS